MIAAAAVVKQQAPYESYDADAVILFAAMAVQPDATRKQLISDTITAGKAHGWWAQSDEIWFPAAHTEQAGTLGWKRVRDCTVVNGALHTVDRGVVGAAGKYWNTNFVASADGVNYVEYAGTILTYLRDDAQVAGYQMATSEGANNTGIAARWSNGNVYGNMHDAGYAGAAIASSLGLTAATRTGENASQVYRNGTLHDSPNTASAAGVPGIAMLIGGMNDDGVLNNVDTRQVAFAGVFGPLDATKHVNLFTDVEAYLDAIGAGVVA